MNEWMNEQTWTSHSESFWGSPTASCKMDLAAQPGHLHPKSPAWTPRIPFQGQFAE